MDEGVSVDEKDGVAGKGVLPENGLVPAVFRTEIETTWDVVS